MAILTADMVIARVRFTGKEIYSQHTTNIKQIHKTFNYILLFHHNNYRYCAHLFIEINVGGINYYLLELFYSFHDRMSGAIHQELTLTKQAELQELLNELGQDTTGIKSILV